MVSGPEQTATPLLDDWLVEVGEDQVVAAVRAARAIDDGTTPGFTDKQGLLAHIGRHAPE